MGTKGIILAGGSGTRLYPATVCVSKQLLPVYDKPMIYYPLSTLLLAGIREILVITTPEHNAQFRQLLGDGSQWGMSLEYAVQNEPRGLADAFIVGTGLHRLGSMRSHPGRQYFLRARYDRDAAPGGRPHGGRHIFAHQVRDPERYGVVELGADGRAIRIVEKPQNPKSRWAVVGLYFYDQRGRGDRADDETLVARRNRDYRCQQCLSGANRINVETFGRGYAWFDAGTPQSLLEASGIREYGRKPPGLKIACLEEIAHSLGISISFSFAS